MSRTDEATLLISASPVRVFTALTTAKSLEKWLAPEGMTARVEKFEARVGGTSRIVLTYEGGADAVGKSTTTHDVVNGRVVEFEAGVRVVQETEFESDDPAYAGVMRLVWEVIADGASARVTFRAEDVPDGISAQDHIEGMSSSLRNLARLVER